jgi:DNA-binding protein HU-beta
MNQAELIAAVSESSGVSKKDTEAVLKSLGAVSHSTLKAGGDIALLGIGKLTVKTRAARTGKNPRTGEVLQIDAKVVPHFSAAKALKDAVV